MPPNTRLKLSVRLAALARDQARPYCRSQGASAAKAPARSLSAVVSPIMAMTKEIQAAIRGFNEIILGGIPFLLQQNETAFLSFMCSVAAIDALAGYRYTTDKVGERFVAFIKDYFPASYAPHAEKLYKLRCRLLHNFSPAHFSLAHASTVAHFQQSHIGDMVLSDDAFFADLRGGRREILRRGADER